MPHGVEVRTVAAGVVSSDGLTSGLGGSAGSSRSHSAHRLWESWTLQRDGLCKADGSWTRLSRTAGGWAWSGTYFWPDFGRGSMATEAVRRRDWRHGRALPFTGRAVLGGRTTAAGRRRLGLVGLHRSPQPSGCFSATRASGGAYPACHSEEGGGPRWLRETGASCGCVRRSLDFDGASGRANAATSWVDGGAVHRPLPSQPGVLALVDSAEGVSPKKGEGSRVGSGW